MVKKLVSQKIELKKPIFLISVPKSGTVLLLNVLNLILGMNNRGPWLDDHSLLKDIIFENRFYNGHLYYTAKGFNVLKNFKKILLYRDPRDYVVSYSFFFNSKVRKPSSIDNFFQKNNYSIDQIISSMIKGIKVGKSVIPSVFEMYERMCLFWISNNSLSIRYEDLLGTKYGGSDKTRYETVSKILTWLNIEIPRNLEDVIIAGVNKGKKIKKTSFRKGVFGDWKNHFSEEQKSLFKLYAPCLVSRLGYEKNENW